MSFDTYELSVEDSEPIELYTFAGPVQTWRLTTYHKDVAFGGDTYVATPGSRSNLLVVDVHADSYDATVELAATHPLVQYYANGVAPREVSFNAKRYQASSGLAIQLWDGFIEALSFKDRMGSFRVPSATAEAMRLDCPSVVAQRLCNHILYDGRCTIARAGFQLVTTIAAISADGRTITTVGSVPGPTNNTPWARHGELLHSATTERRTITEQLALNQFQVQCEFQNASINIGDPVTVFAGCDHQVTTCRDKFANVINFGGFPDLPQSNIFYVGLTSTRYH